MKTKERVEKIRDLRSNTIADKNLLKAIDNIINSKENIENSNALKLKKLLIQRCDLLDGLNERETELKNLRYQ